MKNLDFILLQAGGSDLLGSLVAVLLIMAVMLGVFLIIRALVLWYWKVDVIVKNQEYNNKLLEYNGQLLKEQNDLMKKLVEANADLPVK